MNGRMAARIITVTQMSLALEMATAAGAALAAEEPTAAQMNGRLAARTAAKAGSAVEMDTTTTTTLGAEWQNTLLKCLT